MFVREERTEQDDRRDYTGVDVVPSYRQRSDCLVEQFFREEAKKPPGLRSSSCMISCPCPRCNPYTMSVCPTSSSGSSLCLR